MSDLITQIQLAQRSAAEDAVIARLKAIGLVTESEAEKPEGAQTKAHRQGLEIGAVDEFSGAAN
jgi:hypothetical protein